MSADKIKAAWDAWQAAHKAVTEAITTTSTTAADTIGKAFKPTSRPRKDRSSNSRASSSPGPPKCWRASRRSTPHTTPDRGSPRNENARQSESTRADHIDTGIFAGMPTRDSGGPVVAGKSYLIGGGKAPEIFTPGASGFVTPGGRGGGGSRTTSRSTSRNPRHPRRDRARGRRRAGRADRGQGVRLPYGT